ncbi:MAG: TolC family protein [Nitrospirae bacterium]|nr:TolC family protein [Candidatus Manganitrophaceae bacterium]
MKRAIHLSAVFLISLLVLLGAGRYTEAAEGEAPLELRLSLHDAIAAAMESNPTLQLSRERAEEAEGVVQVSRGAFLPNLSGTVSRTNETIFFGAIGLSGTSDPIDLFDARVQLTQNLFSLSLIQQWRASKVGAKAASLDAEVSRRDTMALIGLLYMEALRAEAAVKASEANVDLSRQLLALARDRKAAGLATNLDVTRAEVQLESEKQRLLVAQNQQDRTKLNLLRSLGISREVALVLTDTLTLVEVDRQSPAEALVAARAQRVELQTQAMREKFASLTLRSIRNEIIPSLRLNANYGRIGTRFDDTVSTRFVGLVLSVPIFEGGSRQGRISQSLSRIRQEEIRTRDLVQQINLEVRDALLTLASARQQVAVSEVGLQLALKELELARQRFEAGFINNIEVTNAQTSVVRARDNEIEALFNFNAARINLARAKGEIDTLN